jgi:hypothetical protein
LKPSATEAAAIRTSGGARSRAFALMQLRVGADFIAVFFRSQDGKSDSRRTTV